MENLEYTTGKVPEAMREYLNELSKRDANDVKLAQAFGYNSIFRWYAWGEAFPNGDKDYAVTIVKAIQDKVRVRGFIGFPENGQNFTGMCLDCDYDSSDRAAFLLMKNIRENFDSEGFMGGIACLLTALATGLAKKMPIEKERLAVNHRLIDEYTVLEKQELAIAKTTLLDRNEDERRVASSGLKWRTVDWWLAKKSSGY